MRRVDRILERGHCQVASCRMFFQLDSDRPECIQLPRPWTDSTGSVLRWSKNFSARVRASPKLPAHADNEREHRIGGCPARKCLVGRLDLTRQFIQPIAL